jgi:hypothetical protein
MRLQVAVKFDNRFPEFEALTIAEIAGGLVRIGEQIMTESKTNYVPVITGNLRNSGTVLPPEVTKNAVRVQLGYGGGAIDYAAKVHEAPPWVGQGKNKYLSIPFNERAGSAPEFIAELLRAVYKRKK